MEGREEWLAHTFIELADTLVADFDVIELMSTLVDRCSELLESSEVGLALADIHGQLRVLASSTERMRVLELIEIQNDEGPCRDCYRGGDRVVNQRLDEAETRWPTFAATGQLCRLQDGARPALAPEKREDWGNEHIQCEPHRIDFARGEPCSGAGGHGHHRHPPRSAR